MGFSQARTTYAWFLTASTYFAAPHPIDTWLSKEQASSIPILEKPKRVEPTGLDKDLKEIALAIRDASPVPTTSLQSLEDLVRRGATVNKSLHSIAATKENSQVLEVLVNLGGDVNYKDELGNTALHVAAATMKAANVEWLMRHGADRSSRNLESKTPLECLQDTAQSYADTSACFGHTRPAGEVDENELRCITALTSSPADQTPLQ